MKMDNWNSVAYACKEKIRLKYNKFWRCIYKFVFRKWPVRKIKINGTYTSIDKDGKIISTSRDGITWLMVEGYQQRKMQAACDVMNSFFEPYKFKVGKCSDGYFMCVAEPSGLVDEFLFRYNQPVFDETGNNVGDTDWSNDKWVENIEILDN